MTDLNSDIESLPVWWKQACRPTACLERYARALEPVWEGACEPVHPSRIFAGTLFILIFVHLFTANIAQNGLDEL